MIWRILYIFDLAVRGVADEPPRTLSAKQGFQSTFRNVSVEIDKSPTFGYVFGDSALIDRCLHFGWTSSPAIWGVCGAAAEHSHNMTTFDNAIVTPDGRAATVHVRVEPPRSGERRANLPADCVFPWGVGGTIRDNYWARMYVDHALSANWKVLFGSAGVSKRPSRTRPTVSVCSVEGLLACPRCLLQKN